MTYHVLARKWRPQTFADLVGQAHVVKALTFALENNQVHHAYLFTGTRGVGKTSIARIFAKSLNCERNGVSAHPCGECENCREIKSGKFVDLIEVDAASRTGVDETRELIDSVAYLPTKGRYKIYLIDEVHMFSKSSFNALLKTLEEPPEYVKFILATTDPEKLPITILSRCLQFNLKSLTKAQIRQHLANICEAESIRYDKEALALLAGAGDGSMRDTLSMTDQAIAYGQGELHTSAVTEILGTIHPADIEAILFAIATNNPNQLNVALHRLDDYEVDARAFLIEIMQRLQRMAWAKEGIVEELSPALLSTVADIPKPLLHLWYDIAEKALPNLAVSGDPRRAVEMALLRMLAFIPSDWVPRHRTVLDESLITPASNAEDAEALDGAIQLSAKAQGAEQPIVESAAVSASSQRGGSDKPKNAESENNQPEISQPEATQLKTVQPETALADNTSVQAAEFAEQVHATPVAHADDLAAAEAQFSGAIGDTVSESTPTLVESSEKTSDAPTMPCADEAIQQSTVVLEPQQTPSQTPQKTAEHSENTAVHHDSWHLAQEPSLEPVPSMDEINAMMQRASEISTSAHSPDDIPPWQPLELPETATEAVPPQLEKETEQEPQKDLGKEPQKEPEKKPRKKSEKESGKKSETHTEIKAENTINEQPLPPRCSREQRGGSTDVDIANFCWVEVIKQLGLSDYTLHFVSLGIVRLQTAGDFIEAVLDLPPTHAVMETKESLGELQSALQNYLQQPVKVSVHLTALNEPVPAEIFQKQQAEQQADLLTQFRQQPVVQQIIENFGGTVIEKTVKPSN